MQGAGRIIAGVGFSVLTTLSAMGIVSLFPGLDVPGVWWIFGAVCPAVISAPVCFILVRQAAENQRLVLQLNDALGSLRRQNEIDPMTGLLNRATFLHQCGEIAPGGEDWVLLIDIDRFKSVNDGFGHHVGDLVLLEVARVLERGIRHTDRCGRLGGEEFAIILRDTSRDEALATAERLRQQTAEIRVATETGQTIRPTISVGLADRQHAESIEHALRIADGAMYVAKQQGRNRVIVAA
jgi:diguanylate cyclase (GGDEF)-like protein